MKILVAGAAGYLGSHLIQVLHEKGHEVIGLDVNASSLEKYSSCLSQKLVVNLTRPEEIKGKLDGIDIVFSAVGLEFPQKNLSYWDIDYQANLNLLKEAETAGVKKFMYISVIHADKPGPLPPILEAKAAIEKQIQASKLEWVIFRPTGYFKDIVNIFLKGAKNGKVRLVGTGEIKANPLHPADFSEFIADSLEAVNEIKEVGGPEVYSYRQLGEIAFEIVNKPPKISCMSVNSFKIFMRVLKIFKPLSYPLLQFSLWCMTNDMVAPQIGTRSIKDALRENA